MPGLRNHRLVLWHAFLIQSLFQRGFLPQQKALQHLAQVLAQMPTIGGLLGVGSTYPCSLSIGTTTVTADDLNAWVIGKPLFQSLSLPIRQQVNRHSSFQIDEDGAEFP